MLISTVSSIRGVIVAGFTVAQLEALEAAIAEGALRVKYADREVTYHSLSDMLRLRDQIKAELGVATSNRSRRYAQFSKGLE